jgi:hypothetical protein
VATESSMGASRLEHASRAQITAGSVARGLNPTRRRYIAEFVRSQGFDPSGLDDQKVGYLFGMLARLEELETTHKHNGHNWELSFAPVARQDNAFIPEMDVRLREWERDGHIHKISESRPTWPDGRPFALCLTHDIDHVSGSLVAERARSLRSFGEAPGREKVIVGLSGIREAARTSLFWKPRPDPPLDTWMDAEDRHGFKSSLFFLASPLPKPHWQDSFYSYNDRVSYRGSRLPLREVMRDIVAQGWDVGLHGASRSSSDASLLREERDIVSEACGAAVVTTRQHHLLYDIRYTPLYHERAGLRADTTMGSNISTGFRCGTCFPFFMYDVAADRPLDVVEVPLTVQDVALFNQMCMSDDLAVSHCVQLMNRVARVGGVMTLLWHNDVQSSNPRFRVYQRLLQAASEMGAWGCSLRQLDQWWRARAEGARAICPESETLLTAPDAR